MAKISLPEEQHSVATSASPKRGILTPITDLNVANNRDKPQNQLSQEEVSPWKDRISQYTNILLLNLLDSYVIAVCMISQHYKLYSRRRRSIHDKVEISYPRRIQITYTWLLFLINAKP